MTDGQKLFAAIKKLMKEDKLTYSTINLLQYIEVMSLEEIKVLINNYDQDNRNKTKQPTTS